MTASLELDTTSKMELATSDGSIQFEATYTPGYTNTLITDGQFNADIAKSELWRNLDKDNHRNRRGYAFDAEHSFKRNFMLPNGSDERTVATRRYHNLVQGLGYTCFSTETTTGEITSIHREFTYPSVDRLNDFMNDVFDGDTIRFVEYEGGEYSALEFAKRFAYDGEVLMSDAQPYAAHDLADHALGWLMMNSELVEDWRDKLGAYVERSVAERDLPIPAMTGVEDYALRVQRKFFNPSLITINAGVAILDEATDSLSYAAFHQDESKMPMIARNIPELIAYNVSNMYGLYTQEQDNVEIPAGLFGRLSHDSLLDWTHAISMRLEKADRAGKEIIAGHSLA